MKIFNLEGYSVQTDSDEQSRELQEMAFEQGLEWASGGVEIMYISLRFFSFSDCIIRYGNCHSDLKQIHFKDIKEYLKDETLEEKLAKSEAEVERLKKEIEEQNKLKVDDWCKFWDNNKDLFIISKLKKIDNDNVPYRCATGVWYKNYEKITNPELIKLLENEK